jgi:hypothetical protein
MPKFFNGTNSPVVIDGYGRFIGGGEWFDVDTTTERIRDLVERGYLVEVATPANEAQEDSAEEQTPKRNTRSVKK